MDRRTRIRWDRLGRWALIAVLAFVVYLYIGPAATWVSTYREAGRKRAEVAALKDENRRLRERRRELRDPQALEREARRLGMVKAGEKSYVIEGLPPQRSRAPGTSLGAVTFETALPQWEEGLRRLQDAPPEQRRTLERVTQAIEDELRRRLGGAFTSTELADLYDEGTGWTADLAVAVAPEEPYAWDARTVADAAFARYLRAATDFAGGRRITLDR